MSYATPDDMSRRFDQVELIQLTDEAALGVIDLVMMQSALDEADNLINSYIASVYTLPLATTPGILKDKACDIGRYRLYKTQPAEEVRTRYKDALDWLKDVATGKVKLDVAGVAVPSIDNSVLVSDSVIASKRDRMRGF